jgi:hypothetical protein
MIKHSIGLEKIIKKRISKGCNYMETLRQLYGADPREVWEVFKEYKNESAEKIGITNPYPELPEPHLAYAQWRITPSSSQLITNKLFLKNYPEICFLGCPVLGMEFEKMLPGKSFLLDVDKTILKYAKNAIHYDVNDEIPKKFANRFECVVTDPPWYYDETKLFIKRASELTKKGGTIYTSLPGLLTRPSIPEERLDFQEWLSNNKLIIAELSSTVEYEVPPFEYMAYKDIPAFTGEVWRKGDFVKLKKANDSNEKLEIKLDQTRWIEYSFDKKRIFLKDRQEEDKYEKPKLSYLYPDNLSILNSVSRRNPIIPQIDIWTSRNAVLHINKGYNVVKTMLDLEEDDSKIIEYISKKYNKNKKEISQDCKEAIKKLRELISI